MEGESGMKECPRSEELIRKLVAGEISSSEWESLRQHAEACEDCRQILEVHEELSDMAHDIPEPAENDFRVMRMNVMAKLARQRPSGWKTFWQDLGFFLRAQPTGAVLVLALFLAGAVYLGRWSATPSRVDDGLLMRTIQTQAATATGVAEYWDTPFSYSNVSARPLPAGQLALSFDVCWHMDVVTRQESAVAKDVLMHAILEPASVGNRLKAMGLTERITDPKLRDAVVFALHHDPNVAIRLKAFEVLSQYPFDSNVQDALLATLKRDESVQMRFQALEYLAGRRVSSETLRQTIDEGGLESDPAIMQRAIELAQQS
jgi:hypothetical protein